MYKSTESGARSSYISKPKQPADLRPTSRSPKSDQPPLSALPTTVQIPGDSSEESLAPTEELNLPLESGQHSPDIEDSFMRDGPHPLSLLSDVGARLRGIVSKEGPSVSTENSFESHNSAQGNDPFNMVIYPGWTSLQLETALKNKRLYYQYGQGAIKRDVAASLDPISRGLITEELAVELVQGLVSLFCTAIHLKVFQVVPTSGGHHGSAATHCRAYEEDLGISSHGCTCRRSPYEAAT